MDFSFIPARQRSTSIPILCKVVGPAESKKTMIKANPGPTSLCIDYILQRPEKLYYRIQDKYSEPLHLESISQYQPHANTE